ncbi:hypothetical protein HRbin39_01660 [bacterium HR39]|nr:hypothetical protein HRbin39_01660 [bacterium HR39]
MFGLSLTKLLFTVLVIVAVWKGFRMLGRLQEQRAERARREAARRAPASAARRTPPPPAPDGTLELEPCPLCGTYVPSGTRCESIQTCTRRREPEPAGRS